MVVITRYYCGPLHFQVHAVFYHVADFCRLMKRGLGPWSEQACESLHHDFARTWEDFKVKSHDHPDFKNRLLRSVCVYNSRHI